MTDKAYNPADNLAPPHREETQVTWLPIRPHFSIEVLHGKGFSTRSGYHESYFSVVSRRPLDAEDFARLDACGLLGMGQAYHVVSTEQFTDQVSAVTVDKRTGQPTDIPPTNRYSGELITATHPYEYYRYEVKRICDSGD